MQKCSISYFRWIIGASYLYAYLPFNEQEVEKKVRKQFKGLFDKKPGEIADAGIQDTEERSTSENQKKDNQEDSDGIEEEALLQDAAAPRGGWFSHIWPTGRKLFSALGFQRCTIL